MSEEEFLLTVEPLCGRLIILETKLRIFLIRVLMKTGKNQWTVLPALRAMIWLSRPIDAWRKLIDTAIAGMSPEVREELLRRWE